ncbi:MAG: TIGR03435 family protein, partial [Bryobacteraceae bacterium]
PLSAYCHSMKTIRISILSALASVAILAQAPPPRVEFEVASIRPSDPILSAADASKIGLHIDGAQVNLGKLSLNDFLAMAYKVKLYQISGPEWMASDRFDINAKLPAGSKGDQIPQMLQALLTDRFGMKFHREMKEFPVYTLVVEKTGLKMKESLPDLADAADQHKSFDVSTSVSQTRTTINYGNGMYITFGDNAFEGNKVPGSAIAEMLARFVDRPVVDKTELKGNYDFKLQFSPEDFIAMMMRAALAAGVALPPEALKSIDASNGDSLFTALETLGLKLEQRKAPIDVLVIDHIEKSPSDN